MIINATTYGSNGGGTAPYFEYVETVDWEESTPSNWAIGYTTASVSDYDDYVIYAKVNTSGYDAYSYEGFVPNHSENGIMGVYGSWGGSENRVSIRTKTVQFKINKVHAVIFGHKKQS